MADATPIIEACLIDNPPSIATLVLAFDCQKDALKLQAGAKARLEIVISQGMEDTDPQRQHIAAEVLLTRRLRQMIYLKENTFIDTSLITCAEYQLFLDEQRAKGKYYQPDHWTSYRFASGEGRIPVLGIRPSDAFAFCEWLTLREAGPWTYRMPKGDEFGRSVDLVHARNLTQTLYGDLIHPRDSKLNLNRARDFAITLIFIHLHYYEQKSSRFDQSQRHGLFHRFNPIKQANNEFLHLIESYTDIYMTLTMLEERIQGRLPACEGVLIVKERKQASAEIYNSIQ